jgi:hypothetical protein
MSNAAHAEPIIRFAEKLAVRVPKGMPAAVQAAARAQFTSPSEFARRALLDALRSAGVELRPDGRIEGRGSAGGAA